MPLRRLSLSFLAMLTVVLLQAGAVRGQTEDLGTATSSIAGRVTMRGKPVAAVPVVAIAGETYNRRDAAARSVTDGEGFYRIKQLLPGQYQVWALSPALLPEQQPSGYSPYGALKTVLVSANEVVENVDLKLITGGVITGRITNEENQPVIEERIWIELLDAKGSPTYRVPQSYNDQARTDDRGIYRVYGLPPGRYQVSVGYYADEGVRGSLYARAFYSEPGDPSKPAVVETKEGGEADHIDIKVGAPAKTFAVSGRITDATTGQPVTGVGFKIGAVEKDSGRTPTFAGLQTENSSEFKFEGLRPGRYSIVATSEFYGGNYFGESVYFDIVDQDVTGIELKAIPGLSVSGTVVADETNLRDVLAAFRDLRVYARSTPPGGVQGSGGGTGPVAADGTFQINGLRPGRIMIDLFAMGPGGRLTVARVERDGVNVARGFDIKESITGLVVVLDFGNGRIRGSVRFAGGGSPPADIRMFVSYKREGEEARETKGAQTDVRGNFRLMNLALGAYEVTLQVLPATRERTQRPIQPQKQIVNVTGDAEAEVIFLVDLGQPVGP